MAVKKNAALKKQGCVLTKNKWWEYYNDLIWSISSSPQLEFPVITVRNGASFQVTFVTHVAWTSLIMRLSSLRSALKWMMIYIIIGESKKRRREETRALIRHLGSVWSCAFTAFPMRRKLLSVGLGALTIWGGTVCVNLAPMTANTPAPALLKGLQTPAAVADRKTGPQVIRNRFDLCWKRPGDSASNLNTSKTKRSEA